MPQHNKLGLSSQEALQHLSKAIWKVLYKKQIRLESRSSSWAWIREAFLHYSNLSSFPWTSCLLIFLEVIILVICFRFNCTERSSYLPIEAFILFVILLCNLYLVGWDAVQRQREMWFRAENIYNTIEGCLKSKTYENWTSGHYPSLFMPQSPCISLQWTYRDGELVNLPQHLLVEGDQIVMRPGHPAPGSCALASDKEITLNLGEMYVPSASESDTAAGNHYQSHVKFRKPLSTAKFIMLETPYIRSLKLAMKRSLERPVTLFNRERHLVMFYLERMAIPIIIIFILCVETLHTVYLAEESRHWAESLLLRPALAVLPLLPLALPFCWFMLNITGVAYLLALTDIYTHAQRQVPMPLEAYSEVDEESTAPSPKGVVSWQAMRKLLFDLYFSHGGYLWRSSNMLQVLGSVTAFCCVDKKGILSWPNPSAEKVFFLRSSVQFKHSAEISHQHHQHHYHHHNVDNQGIPASLEDNAYFSTPSLVEAFEDSADDSMNRGDLIHDYEYDGSSKAEVLDLTHNVLNDFTVQFDDPQWKKHIANLKPLGLSILLNTCNPAAQEHYARFWDHITCESLSNDAAVPVVNKRCLCELARHIGFTEGAITSYHLQELMATFRHVQPDLVRKGRLARTLNLSRLKMPFPYVSGAIIKDPHTGSHQLFTQGTGDLLVDTCSDYWDGKGLTTLTESDRKRILDFYQRSSLTAYCMAFSYAPLGQPPQAGLTQEYLELPPDTSQTLKKRLRNNSSGAGTPNRNRTVGNDDVLTVRHFGEDFPLKPYLSTDSLLFCRDAEDRGDQTSTGPEIPKEEQFLEILSNQIFIGMVTMQYQPCPDIVQLIEHLDKACIRFVHFSKENELRSRVFSEKMGLESGWNCHISLLSEKTRSESGGSAKQHQHLSWNSVQGSDVNPLTSSDSIHIGNDTRNLRLLAPLRCVSAPSLVNLDTFTVRFEDEVSLYSSQQSSELGMSRQNSTVFRNNEESLVNNVEPNELQPLTPCNAATLTPFARNIREDGSNQGSGRRRLNSSTPLRGSTLSQSPSHVTESTEQSVPVTFDMSNRAKLPKGIENIRPHLEHVDNVPLLVSLFTDCTPQATEEMIRIMQEYGEVVACFGSSSNIHNFSIFLQADVSIGVEPMFPQVCRDQPVFMCDNGSKKGSRNATLDLKAEIDIDTPKLSPAELSRRLNLLPCAFGIHRDDPISLYHIIMEARHLTSGMQNSLQFMLCCCLSLSLLQFLCNLFFLPPPLGVTHLMWLVCLQVPLLSMSLLGNPCDRQVLALATGKNVKIVSKQTIVFFLGCYAIKFCPSIIMICACFGTTVAYFCRNSLEVKIPALGRGTCWVFVDSQTNITDRKVLPSSPFTSPADVWISSITLCQNIVAFFVLVYFVIISAGFVHRMNMLWERNPFRNQCWTLVCTIVLILQFIFCLVDLAAYADHRYIPVLLNEVPYYVWILLTVWPLPLLFVNALIKRHEIKVNVRQQKRVRLEFGTKLGMNSPF